MRLIITSVLLAAASALALAQPIGCPDDHLVSNTGEICGVGLLSGQSFVAPATGWIDTLRVVHCQSSFTEIAFRIAPDEGAEWNSGEIIGTTTVVGPIDGPESNCNPSNNGLISYSWTELAVNGVGVEAGKLYFIEFLQGYGASGCGPGFPDGHAHYPFAAAPLEDLLFELEICEDDIPFGCTDEDACNFDAAASVTDGSCLEEDCHGDCGGSAFLSVDCGCIGGNTGLTEDICYGCTEELACNFDPQAIIDDGSCQVLDCMDVCGGEAYLTDCGCVGGTSPLPPNRCIDGCLTTTLGDDRSPCAPVLMKGQTFTVSERGILKRIGVASCCASEVQLAIRSAPKDWECDPETLWNQGEILLTTQQQGPICAGMANCQQPTEDGYPMRYFESDDVMLESDITYVIEFVAGFGTGACSAGDLPGTGFRTFGPPGPLSLLFELDLCQSDSALTSFGCTDPLAGNFNNLAIENDGSCLYEDCAGELGGLATNGPCGCLDTLSAHTRLGCISGQLQEIESNHGSSCGLTGHGQTWTQAQDGFLHGLQLLADETSDVAVNLFIHDGPFADSLLASTSAVGVAAGICGAEIKERDLIFQGIPLQSGRQYRIELTQGSAMLNCTSSYPNGQGLDEEGQPLNLDLSFLLAYRLPEPNELIWGCRQPEACNFADQSTHNSGDCLTDDCNGDCGGEAVFIEGCGCREGNTGMASSSCYGCTDSNACNYNPGSPIDDGSCVEPDCAGVCGGFAVYVPECGCVGGTTGQNPDNCLTQCQASSHLSNFGAASFFQSLFSSGSIQRIETESTAYLTGVKLLQASTPEGPFKIEIRKGTSFSSAQILDTITVASFNEIDLFNQPILIAFAPLNTPIAFDEDETLWLQLTDGNWLAPNTPFNSIPNGEAYTFHGAQPANDWFLELLSCDEVLGCTDETACNFEPWASALLEGSCVADCTNPLANNYNPDPDPNCINNEYCQFNVGCMDPAACNFDTAATYQMHPITSEIVLCVYGDPSQCIGCSGELDGTGVTQLQDSDLDGICNWDEIMGCRNPDACNFNEFATDDAPCVFPSSCSTCSGETDGTGYPIVTIDVDEDGVCDLIDNCTDINADNYNDPQNGVCRGPCDTAPLFDTIEYVSAASSRFSMDGAIRIETSVGFLPDVPFESHIPVQLVLEGHNEDLHFEFDLPADEFNVPAGFYQAAIYNSEGCPGVREAPSGTSFGQPPVYRNIVVLYEQCCGGCGTRDIDADGICDQNDACTDKNANNYDDPANEPCEY